MRNALPTSNSLRWLWLSLAVLMLDQISKHWVLNHLAINERIPVVPFFDITLRYNTGAAFSFLAQAGGWAAWFFGGIAVIASVVIIILLRRLSKDKRWLAIALALILGGALGNLQDRIYHGYVVDFLLFYVGEWQWPAFNVADSAICIGAAMMIIAVLRKRV